MNCSSKRSSRAVRPLPCCISFEVLPEIKEYERTSTTVINTYIMPVVAQYLSTLRQELGRIDCQRHCCSCSPMAA